MTQTTLGGPDRTIFKATGPPDHWLTTLVTGIWGFTEDNRSAWERVESGDIIVFHSTGTDTHDGSWESGLVGYGVVESCERKDYPLWRSETEAEENQYPYIALLRETYWRGSLRDIDGAPIGSKSVEQIHAEIRALLTDRVELSTFSDRFDYNFPVMGSFSEFQYADETLDLFHEQPMTRVQYRERESGDTTTDSSPTVSFDDIAATTELTVDTDTLFDGLYFPDAERERIASAVAAAIHSGKHLIFTGPPGTGKTELAENLCTALTDANRQYTGYQVTTATADWSTFDTVGGYMPRESGDGSLEFNPGQILRRLANGDRARNELLVIDEINRADIDKAFGQLFTVLSGQAVQLPFEQGGEEITISPSTEIEWGALTATDYVVPESWRLLATMNSYDKTSLYEMSYAFMRRFTFVRVGTPANDRLEEAVDEYVARWNVAPTATQQVAVTDIWKRTNESGRPIGPALVKDMLGMVTNGGGVTESTTQAVVSYVFPQLEGVPDRKRVVASLCDSEYVDADRLRTVASEMLQVRFDETQRTA
ncbi:AAA family ATPase [Natronomonas sp. EA1]|uniref:AAA family ATPase n=1 Tax=Natronomonas sp. EA1 TaxID=3421655 RepID=UPI003EB9E8CD